MILLLSLRDGSRVRTTRGMKSPMSPSAERMSVAIPGRLGARAANTTDKKTAIKGQSFCSAHGI